MEERPADAEESAVPSRQHDSASAPEETATFFSTPELRQRLDLLRHLTDNSEKILLIKGVDGSGKSTLLQQFRWLSRDEWMICCLSADAMLQPDQFFSLLFRRFGLTDSTVLNIDALVKRFEMLHAAGRLPVIVVDDAHLLPLATLIALFRLFERRPGNRALIRVVLFATPEINTQLQTPQLQAMNLQCIQSLDMPLFDMAQAQAFIEFLLDVEDNQQQLTLAAGRIERIVKDSGGVPGLLEAQLQSVFAVAPEPVPESVVESAGKASIGVRTILADLPVSVLVGVPLLALLLLLTLIFQDAINNLFDQTGVESVAQDTVTPGKDGLRPLKLPEPDNRVEPEDTASTVEEDLQEELPVVADVPAAGPELPELMPPLQTEVDPLAEPEAASPASTAADEPKLPEVAASAADDAGMVTAIDTPQAAAPASGGHPAAEEATVVDDARMVQPAAEEKPVGVLGESPTALDVSDKKPVKDEKWILTRRPEDYTLQLVGVRDEAAVKRFIGQHRLKGEAAYFKTIRSGQPWYAVIYGVYPDRSAALKGRETLPPALQKSDVWPRTFASIQAVVGK